MMSAGGNFRPTRAEAVIRDIGPVAGTGRVADVKGAARATTCDAFVDAL